MSSYVTVPRVVGLVALVVVGAVLYVADQSAETKSVVMRYLKSDKSSSSSDRIKFDEVPLTSDLNAPIWMIDHTGSHPFLTMMKKFYMTGTEPATTAEPEATKYNWVRATITPNDNCKSRKKYVIGGIAASQCVNTGSGGVIVSCSSDGKSVNYYTYKSKKCSGNPLTSTMVTAAGCAGLVTGVTPWGTYTDDTVKDGTYKRSIQYECLSIGKHEDPSEIAGTHLDIYKGYSDSKCGANNYLFFEGMYGDTCIPIKVINGFTFNSVMFKYDTGTTDYPFTDPYIYGKFYATSRTCQGPMQEIEMPMVCSGGVRWTYWNSLSTDDYNVDRK